MNRNMGFGWALMPVLVSLLGALAVGCGGGQPGYVDPVGDLGECEPAEEFEYLVDIQSGALSLSEDITQRKRGMEDDAVKMANQMQTFLYGMTAIDCDEIMAEASETWVHAHAEYRISRGVDNPLLGLTGAGTAEVKLPAHFPQERWLGHLFLANPGRLIREAFEAVEEQMQAFQEEMEALQRQMGGRGFGDMEDISGLFSADTMASLIGCEDAEEIYGWMGGELIMFAITNPDFEPDSESESEGPFENPASYSVLAIASRSPEEGMEVIENIMRAAYIMFGAMQDMERTDLMGYDALIFRTPDLEDSLFGEMLTEEQKERMEEAPDSVVAAVPGYLFFADRRSVEAALEIFEPRARGTGRTTTLEAECNLDILKERWAPANTNPFFEAIGRPIPEMEELFERLQEATCDMGELRTSRFGMSMTSTGRLELDVIASRESIAFFEAIGEVLEETPDEVLREIGRQMGETMAQQGAFPGMGAGQEFDFDFGS